MKLLTSRKFRQGSLATVMTALGVALIIILTIVLSMLSGRFHWTLDLTTDQIFAISPETEEFVAGLTNDVEIYVLNSEDGFLANSPQTYMVQANEVIKKYEALSPRIEVSYVDIIATPTFTAEYSDLSLAPNQILLVCPQTGHSDVVEYLDLFNIQTDQYGQSAVRSSKAEQMMTSAILNVTSEEKTRVTVLGGHNEGDLTAFTSFLEANNYEIVTQNLLTDEQVDPEATIALMAMPARDLNEDELRKLDTFLTNGNNLGKTLFYMASGDTAGSASFPNLSAWLAEWGVAVNDGVVFESDPSYMLIPTNPLVALASYAEEEYSAAAAAKQLYPAVFNARPLEVVFPVGSEGVPVKGSRSATTLLQFSAASGVMTDELPPWPPAAEYLSGPIPTLVKCTEMRYDNLTQLTSNVLVSGSFYSLDEQFLGGVSFSNAEYFLGLLNALAGREDTVTIQDKTISMESIEMTVSQINFISISVFALLPAALLIFGIVVWVRRRHR